MNALKLKYYDYGDIWSTILPDGSSFCHWGGRKLSNILLDKIPNKGRLLDLCCGSGGTLSIANREETYGLDLSINALRLASKVAKKATFICGDAKVLAFGDFTFDNALMQDGDAWFDGSIEIVLREVWRILKPQGSFIIQTYYDTGVANKSESQTTQRLLSELGYPATTIPKLLSLEKALKSVGFESLTVESLHDHYETDAIAMAERFQQYKAELCRHFEEREVLQLGRWVDWSLQLYRRKLWSGALLSVTKVSKKKLIA